MHLISLLFSAVTEDGSLYINSDVISALDW